LQRINVYLLKRFIKYIDPTHAPAEAPKIKAEAKAAFLILFLSNVSG